MGSSTVQPTARLPLATTASAGLMSAVQAAFLFGVGSNTAVLGYFYSAVLDLTQTGLYVIVAPTSGRFRLSSSVWNIVTSTSVSVAPTMSVGSDNPSYINYHSSQTPAGFTTATATQPVALNVNNPNNFNDITTNGIKVSITAGATATALTARLFMLGSIVPL